MWLQNSLPFYFIAVISIILLRILSAMAMESDKNNNQCQYFGYERHEVQFPIPKISSADQIVSHMPPPKLTASVSPQIINEVSPANFVAFIFSEVDGKQKLQFPVLIKFFSTYFTPPDLYVEAKNIQILKEAKLWKDSDFFNIIMKSLPEGLPELKVYKLEMHVLLVAHFLSMELDEVAYFYNTLDLSFVRSHYHDNPNDEGIRMKIAVCSVLKEKDGQQRRQELIDDMIRKAVLPLTFYRTPINFEFLKSQSDAAIVAAAARDAAAKAALSNKFIQ